VGSAGPIDRQVETYRAGTRPAMLHLDDMTTATGFVDGGTRTMALAIDAAVAQQIRSDPAVPCRDGIPSWHGAGSRQLGRATGRGHATGLAVRL
jgi:hypothetical protein